MRHNGSPSGTKKEYATSTRSFSQPDYNAIVGFVDIQPFVRGRHALSAPQPAPAALRLEPKWRPNPQGRALLSTAVITY